MTTPAETGNNAGNSEIPLGFQLTKESQSMISKLSKLNLDDPSARGMAVFGDNGNQTAILFGKVANSVTGSEKHLVISPKGFFLVASGAEAAPDRDILSETLKMAAVSTVSFEQDQMGQYVRLKISQQNNYQSFKLREIKDDPKTFAELLKSAIESSREVAQKPLREKMAMARAGNAMLDVLIQQENPSSVAPA